MLRIFSFLLFSGCFSVNNAQNLALVFSDTIFMEPGTTAVVDLQVYGFQQIGAFNFVLQYDTTVIRVVNAIPQSLPDVFVNVQNAIVTTIWSSPTGTAISLPDGSSILQLSIESRQIFPAITKIQFAAEPLPTEFFSFNGSLPLPVNLTLGEAVIIVRNCSTTLELGADPSVCPGDSLVLQSLCTNCTLLTWPDSSHTSSLIVQQPGWIIANAEGSLHCYATDSVFISLAPLPQFTFPQTSIIRCGIDTVELGPIPAVLGEYKWSNGATGTTLDVTQAGTYTLTITNDFNCAVIDSVVVIQHDKPGISFDIKQPDCKSLSGAIEFTGISSANMPYLYSIDNGQNLLSGGQFNALVPDTYFMAVQDVDGCLFVLDTITLYPAFIPEINLPESEITFNAGDSILLQAQLPAAYPVALVQSISWSPLVNLTFAGSDLNDLLQPTIRPTTSGFYTVTLESTDGCFLYDSVFLRRIDTAPLIMYIPNAIAPRSSQENQWLTVFANDDRIDYIDRLAVFDRWGGLVFEKHDLMPNNKEQGWDGTSGGRIIVAGVYIWQLSLNLKDGSKVTRSGAVTVVD